MPIPLFVCLYKAWKRATRPHNQSAAWCFMFVLAGLLAGALGKRLLEERGRRGERERERRERGKRGERGEGREATLTVSFANHAF